MSVNKVKKIRLADQVSDMIKESIISQEWKPDHKIPSEQELAKTFGVNRLTVRMALQKLSVLGIVETRAGEGTFVKKFDFQSYISEVSDMLMTAEMLDDVLEFRRLIEVECIKLAIDCANDEDIAQLEEAYNNYYFIAENPDKNKDKQIDRIITADLDFHLQICKISKNSLFPLAYIAVREPLYQYIKVIIQKRSDENQSNKQLGGIHHKMIVNAIKNRDFKLCEKIYLDMIDYKQ